MLFRSQAEDGIRDVAVTGVQTCALPIFFKLTGIKKTKVLFSLNHGWKYSSNSNSLNIKSYWNSSLNLGVCADWFVGPRLEAGWISAYDLDRKSVV